MDQCTAYGIHCTLASQTRTPPCSQRQMSLRLSGYPLDPSAATRIDGAHPNFTRASGQLSACRGPVPKLDISYPELKDGVPVPLNPPQCGRRMTDCALDRRSSINDNVHTRGPCHTPILGLCRWRRVNLPASRGETAAPRPPPRPLPPCSVSSSEASASPHQSRRW
jgi:hypothetical protein